MKSTVLLVEDVQKGLMGEKPYRGTEFLQKIAALISICRKSGAEVVYIQNDGGKGSLLEAGTAGFEICGEVAPKSGEKVITKRYSSAFLQTELDPYLKKKGIQNLILVGMQTEYCIDATCKSAFEHGFRVLIPEGTFTTFDNAPFSAAQLCNFYAGKIWNGRFATVLPFGEVKDRIASGRL